MPADIIVYALIAAGLVFWLRNILGTRHGEERERPNPLEPKQTGVKDAGADPFIDSATPSHTRELSQEEKIEKLTLNPGPVSAVDNKTAEQGLIEISKLSKSFDIDVFLEGAQEAFVIIVEAFAKTERDTLKELLSESVYSAFDTAIKEREEKSHTLVTDILAVRKADILEAKLEGRMAFITVKFEAEETSVTRDENGEIIEGDAERISTMKDIWVFGRDIKSRDPRWLVYETRGDFEGDNEIIPDTN